MVDKYEYKLKLEQIQNLFAAGDYLTAAEMADTINWKKSAAAQRCAWLARFMKNRQIRCMP